MPLENHGHGSTKFPSVLLSLRNRQVFIWSLPGTFLPSWVVNATVYFSVVQSCFLVYNITVQQCTVYTACRLILVKPTDWLSSRSWEPTTEEGTKAKTNPPNNFAPFVILSHALANTTSSLEYERSVENIDHASQMCIFLNKILEKEWMCIFLTKKKINIRACNESQLRSKTTGKVLRLNKALKKHNNTTQQPARPKDPDKLKIFTRHWNKGRQWFI